MPTSRSAPTSTDESGCSVSTRTISGAASTAIAVMTASTMADTVSDGVGRLVVVVLELGGEDRHERRRQHAAEDQLVDDVRRVVGQVVGVGEAGLAEGVGQRDPAQQAGHPGERGAEPDRDVGAQQPLAAGLAHVEAPGGGSVPPAAGGPRLLHARVVDGPAAARLLECQAQRLHLLDQPVDVAGEQRIGGVAGADRHLDGAGHQLVEAGVDHPQLVLAPRGRRLPSGPAESSWALERLGGAVGGDARLARAAQLVQLLTAGGDVDAGERVVDLLAAAGDLLGLVDAAVDALADDAEVVAERARRPSSRPLAGSGPWPPARRRRSRATVRAGCSPSPSGVAGRSKAVKPTRTTHASSAEADGGEHRQADERARPRRRRRGAAGPTGETIA